MRVDQVTTSRVVAKVKPKTRPLGSQYHHDIKVRSPIGQYKDSGIIGGAKSEYNFPLNNNSKARDWDKKSREMPQLSYIPRRKSPSKFYQAGGIDGQVSFQGTNLLEAEVYKDGYEKLKQKYKKES